MNKVTSSEVMCAALRHQVSPSRFVWLVLGTDLAPMLYSGDLQCDLKTFKHVYYFHISAQLAYGQVGIFLKFVVI